MKTDMCTVSGAAFRFVFVYEGINFVSFYNCALPDNGSLRPDVRRSLWVLKYSCNYSGVHRTL